MVARYSFLCFSSSSGFFGFLTLRVSAPVLRFASSQVRVRLCAPVASDATASELLLKTKSTKEASLSELQTLNQKIEARNKLIRTMDRQIRSIDREVTRKAKEIKKLEIRVDSLKSDYADLIKLAQRQQKPRDQILFILSSSSFAQAAKRMQYFKDMAAYRERQVQQIAVAQEALARERETLIAKKAEKIQVDGISCHQYAD